jgi:hypothetical protein
MHLRLHMFPQALAHSLELRNPNIAGFASFLSLSKPIHCVDPSFASLVLKFLYVEHYATLFDVRRMPYDDQCRYWPLITKTGAILPSYD